MLPFLCAIIQPFKVLIQAIDKVPLVKYALGVAAVGEAITIIKSFGEVLRASHQLVQLEFGENRLSQLVFPDGPRANSSWKGTGLACFSYSQVCIIESHYTLLIKVKFFSLQTAKPAVDGKTCRLFTGW